MPPVLLLHGPLQTSSSLKEIAIRLEDEYYVVVPSIDGSYEETSYEGAYRESNKIIRYLKDEKLTHLEMIYSVSSSYAIVMEMIRSREIDANEYIYESVAYYPEIALVRSAITRKINGALNQYRAISYEEFQKAFLEENIVKTLLGDDLDIYLPMLKDAYNVLKVMDKKTLSNIIKDIMNYGIIRMDDRMMDQSYFIFGKDGVLMKVKNLLLRRYTKAHFIDMDGYYCTAMVEDPEAYTKQLKEMIKKRL